MARILCLSLLLLLLSTQTATAETVTWTMTDVPHGTTLIDLDTVLTGVTNINLRVVGFGGYDYVVCDSFPESESYSAPVYLAIGLDGTAARGGFEVPMLEAFDISEDMTLDEELIGADFLSNGMFELYVWDQTSYYEPSICYTFGLHCVNSTIDELTLIFTCESAVSNENSTWGEIKAIYR